MHEIPQQKTYKNKSVLAVPQGSALLQDVCFLFYVLIGAGRISSCHNDPLGQQSRTLLCCFWLITMSRRFIPYIKNLFLKEQFA